MGAIRVLMAVAVLLGVVPGTTEGQNVIDGYAAHVLRGSNGTMMPYRLFIPDDHRTEPLPLVVYLHGGGGAGIDNVQQLSRGNTVPLTLFASADLQALHRTFVVAPQAPANRVWHSLDSDALAQYGELVVELVDTLIQQYGIDPDRVYLTGVSRGGRGTWDIARKRPDLFAAAVPSCGEGTPSKAAALRDLPIWAFHGSLDSTVLVRGSRDMVAALRALGSPVKYTEYPGEAHNACTFPYLDPELPVWLFQQRRQ